jgi:hypothetical protein
MLHGRHLDQLQRRAGNTGMKHSGNTIVVFCIERAG